MRQTAHSINLLSSSFHRQSKLVKCLGLSLLVLVVGCTTEIAPEPSLVADTVQVTSTETATLVPTVEPNTKEPEVDTVALPLEPLPDAPILGPENVAGLQRFGVTPGQVLFSPNMQMVQWITPDGVTLARTEDFASTYHREDALCAVFSPDGETLAWRLIDDSVVIWDVSLNREERFPPDLSAGWCGAFSFSPDNRYFVIEQLDPILFKVVTLWDLEQARQVSSWTPYQNPQFSPDGMMLGMQSNSEFGATLVDIEGLEMTTLPTTFSTAAPFYALQYGPTWQTFAFYARSGGNILDVASGETTMPFIGDTVAISPDGATLATSETGWIGDSECTRAVCLYDIHSQTLRAVLPHESIVWTMAFSPDGRILATEDGNRIRLWDIEQEIELTNVQVDSGDVWDIGFSPDGRYLLTYAHSTAEEGHVTEIWGSQVEKEYSRIRFDPGATAWATEERTRPAETHRYVLFALEGQTMQVYLDGNGTSLSIFGDDGSILTGAVRDRPFWRGELPLSQDYFIELQTFNQDWVDQSISLSIAIAPLGEESQTFHYTDPNDYFALEYSDYFAIDPSPDLNPILKGEERLRLRFVGTEFFEGTNLENATVAIARSADPEILADCQSALGLYEQDQGRETINDYEYFKWSSSDSGMGRGYLQTAYRSSYAGACFEFVIFEEGYTIGHGIPDDPTEEYDREGLLEKMMELLRGLELNG